MLLHQSRSSFGKVCVYILSLCLVGVPSAWLCSCNSFRTYLRGMCYVLCPWGVPLAVPCRSCSSTLVNEKTKKSCCQFCFVLHFFKFEVCFAAVVFACLCRCVHFKFVVSRARLKLSGGWVGVVFTLGS